LHEYLQEMHQEALGKYDIMTVGEAIGVSVEQALDFVDEDRKELNMFFHFDLMWLDRDPEEGTQMRADGWKLTEFKEVHSKWDAAFAKKGWGSMFLNNHDFPRSLSRWGNDTTAHWYNSATMLQTFLLSMRGTPYFYYGEEIGMTNIRFDKVDDYKDINTLNKYETLSKNPKNIAEFIANEKDASRDNARTPMQWDNTHNAGFTSGQPWIKVNKNYQDGINVAAQMSDKTSVLNYFRNMVQVRKNNLVLVYGSYELLLADNEQIYAYTRTLGEDRCLVLLSFATQKVLISLDEIKFDTAKLLISNDEDHAPQIKKDALFDLKPYQAVIYKLHG
ncbi:MAG: alpha-amylase family glycosyl hydrolase, partial [Bacteroidota bacterium]